MIGRPSLTAPSRRAMAVFMSLSSPDSRSLAINGDEGEREKIVTCPSHIPESAREAWTSSVISTKSGTAKVLTVHSLWCVRMFARWYGRLRFVGDVEDRIADLYAVDLQDFVRARSDLAQSLKEGGDTSAAQRVSSLKKPVLTVWVVNGLARRRAEEVRALIEQDAPQTGEELRAASAARRKLLNGLRAEAQRILEGAGKSASPAALQRVGRALEGAAQSDSVNLLAGTVEKESEPVAHLVATGGIWAETDEVPDSERRQLLEHAERSEQEAEEMTARAVEAEGEARRLADLAARARTQARAAREEAQRAARVR